MTFLRGKSWKLYCDKTRSWAAETLLGSEMDPTTEILGEFSFQVSNFSLVKCCQKVTSMIGCKGCVLIGLKIVLVSTIII